MFADVACLKDEWVISRVFQKTGAGVAAASGGGKKGKAAVISLYSEVCSSPSTASFTQQLPALLDSASPYGGADSCSYEGGEVNAIAKQEHVSCFSTTNVNNTNSVISTFNPFELNFSTPPPPPPLPPQRGFSLGGLPAFPSLRSLQDNLHLPWIGGLPSQSDGRSNGGEFGLVMGNWGTAGGDAAAATEVDCMWNY